MKGANNNSLEKFKYSYWIELFCLLEMGIPYSSIEEMSEDTIQSLFATKAAMNQVRKEASDNAK